MGRRAIRLGGMAAVVLATAAIVLGLDACTGDDDDPETPADILERGGSIASITIDATAYEFEVTCYDAGAGSVIAVGTGTEVDRATGEERESRVFVQAFLGDPYIGVTVAVAEPGTTAVREVVYEAALDETFDLLLDGNVIAADDIEFVRNLDLTSGTGEPAGVGSVRVTCNDFEQGVPPGLER